MKLSECRGLNKYEILFSKTSNQVKWHEIKQNTIYFVIQSSKTKTNWNAANSELIRWS